MARRTLAAAAFGTALVLTPAGAATITTTFAVNMTVQATCLISALPLAFGTYTGLLINAATTITITCTNTTTYNVGLSPGVGTGATVTNRLMTSGTNTVVYALFSDAARSINWGQTVPTDTVPGTGNGAAQVLNVYGRVAAGSYVTPGAYTDTITATVTY
jgi:spore coat protein U-like protein